MNSYLKIEKYSPSIVRIRKNHILYILQLKVLKIHFFSFFSFSFPPFQFYFVFIKVTINSLYNTFLNLIRNTKEDIFEKIF